MQENHELEVGSEAEQWELDDLIYERQVIERLRDELKQQVDQQRKGRRGRRGSYSCDVTHIY